MTDEKKPAANADAFETPQFSRTRTLASSFTCGPP
jgi:hypothetical protein